MGSSDIQSALRSLNPLLRRKGTSPDVGKSLRRAVHDLEAVLTSNSDFIRKAALESAIAQLQSCLATIEQSIRAPDRDQLKGTLEALAILTALEFQAAQPEPRPVPAMGTAAPKVPAPPSVRPALSARRQGHQGIRWDIFEEHLDEAAFLWDEWEYSLAAANYTLGDVAAGPEARLLAHLDGLVLGGGAVAEKILSPALTSDEPGRVAAAAWAMVQSEDGKPSDDGYQGAVIGAMVKGEPTARAAIARALALSPRADLDRVERVWRTGPPELRALAFDLLAAVKPGWARDNVELVLRDSDAALMASGLRALRRFPARVLAGCVEDALQMEAPEVRREAIMTGLVFELPMTWEVCHQVALCADDGARLALAMLAASSRPADRSTVLALASDPKLKRHALWALGFSGDSDAVAVLVEATADQAVAKVAGEALSAITGLQVEGALATPGKTTGPDIEEVGDDDPPPVVLKEDHLPLPDAAAVKQWWRREGTRFAAGMRHICGQRRTPDTLRAAMTTAATWRREVMALDLARTTGAGLPVDVRTWTRDQRRALGACGIGDAAANRR